MGYHITYKDTTSDAFVFAVKELKKRLSKMCKENDWELCDYHAGHFFISCFIRDSNGNFTYVHKYNFDGFFFDYPSTLSEKDICKWIDFSETLYRTAKSLKDFTGGCNNYCKELAQLPDCLCALFSKQKVKSSRKTVCKRFRRK